MCIQNDDEVSVAQIMEIIWSELVENYLPPFVGSVLLLFCQLSENIKSVGDIKKNS